MRTSLLLLAALTYSAFGTASAQDVAIGAGEFRASCAVCHGVEGKGDGPLAGLLTIKPPDLTVLSKQNDNRFPLLEVFHTVDGRTQVTGHGTRDMPVWGERYTAEAGQTYGPYGGEAAVRARILELLFYLESIQE